MRSAPAGERERRQSARVVRTSARGGPPCPGRLRPHPDTLSRCAGERVFAVPRVEYILQSPPQVAASVTRSPPELNLRIGRWAQENVADVRDDLCVRVARRAAQLLPFGI